VRWARAGRHREGPRAGIRSGGRRQPALTSILSPRFAGERRVVLAPAAAYLARPDPEISMRLDVEAAKADIEQSIELLRRRL
jgi:hypothetical protein